MKELWKGNEAIAEAAVRAGLALYIGYPITPQSEIMEYLSKRLPELGRVFIQSESELVSINGAIGAAHTGYRAMTSSTCVGISLMQEGMTAAFQKCLPILLVNVNRTGCGMGFGDYPGAQDNYTRETRGGGNGDYRTLVYMPSSIQEAVDLIYTKWDVAEKYRIPMEILTVGRLGQMMETVEFPPLKEPKQAEWGMNGRRDNPGDFAKAYPIPKQPAYFLNKMKEIEENEQDWENFMLEDAETVIVAAGLVARVAKKAILNLREKGYKVGLLRPISAWPYPVKGYEQLPDTVKKIVSLETTSMGQLLTDVLCTVKRIKKLNDKPVYSWARLMPLFNAKEIEDYILRVENGEEKEVAK